jgi:hypothetical protein
MVKSRTNIILNCTSAPAYTWLFCLQYVSTLFNHVSSDALTFKILTSDTEKIVYRSNVRSVTKVPNKRLLTDGELSTPRVFIQSKSDLDHNYQRYPASHQWN